jgi:hypothetical protein
MAQTITPVVHGGRGARWASVIALHVLGATVSAALLGAALGATGMALGAPWGALGTLAVVAVAGTYALRELAGVRVPIPELRRQVPEWWRSTFSPGTAATLYGLGLGIGFATHLRHGTLVAVAAASLASGDPLLAAVAMGAFGVARSAAVGIAWMFADDVGSLTHALERLAIRPEGRVLNGLALGSIVIVGAASASSSGTGRVTPVAAAAVAAGFGVAAVAKVLRWGIWRRALSAYRLPSPVEPVAAILVPMAEAVVPVTILAGATQIGAAMGLALVVVFSAAVIRAALTRGDSLPCGCFGRAESRSARIMLARNLVIAGLAVTAIGSGRSPLPSIGPGEVLPVLLAAAGVALVGALVFGANRLLRRERA